MERHHRILTSPDPRSEIEDEIDQRSLPDVIQRAMKEVLTPEETEALNLLYLTGMNSNTTATLLSMLTDQKFNEKMVNELETSALEKLRSSKTLKNFLGIEDNGITT